MADDLYSDAPDAAPSEPVPADKPADDKGDQTSILPKSFFGGGDLKPGDRCTIEIVSLQPDQAMVKYVSEDAGEEKEVEPPAAAPQPAMAGAGGGGMYD
jgi:hypothetical protein